jgi:hypothetical protein
MEILTEIVKSYPIAIGMVLIWFLAAKQIDRNTQALNKLAECINRLEGKIK